jgi:hypothetical protein
LLDFRLGLLPVRKLLRQAFEQHFAQDPGIVIRGQKKRDRLIVDEDALRDLFDLAQPFKIGDRAREIFCADAEQGRQRGLQEFRDPLERFEFDRPLASFVVVKRSAGNSEALRRFFGRESQTHTMGPKTLTDLNVIDGHEFLRRYGWRAHHDPI